MDYRVPRFGKVKRKRENFYIMKNLLLRVFIQQYNLLSVTSFTNRVLFAAGKMNLTFMVTLLKASWCVEVRTSSYVFFAKLFDQIFIQHSSFASWRSEVRFSRLFAKLSVLICLIFDNFTFYYQNFSLFTCSSVNIFHIHISL